MAVELRAHLDELVAGRGRDARNCPTDECFEVSKAIAACAAESVRAHQGWAVNEPLCPPSDMLPPLP